MSDDQSLNELLNNAEAMDQTAQLIEKATANGMTAMANGVPQELANRAVTLALLSALGDRKVRQEDSLVFEGTKFVLPEQYQGNIPAAVKFLKDHDKAQAAKIDLVRQFPYRVYDVAHATHQAMIRVFGYGGKGIAIKSMFGDIEPAMVDVEVGIGKKVQVPWNRIAFSPLHGHIDVSYARTPNGLVGQVTVNAPRGMRQIVEGFFEFIEEELRERSIYRGKAIAHTKNGEVEFIDLSKVKRENVVYSDEVMAQLEANLFVVLRNMDAMRKAGQPIKRSVLLEGPYGTGKSLAGFLTAQQCIANGITFIFAKPGADLTEAKETAKLYAPAVVFFEDIDTLESTDPEEVSKLLEAFDGVGSKGKEVITVLTTNNRDKIHKGMLRPGRLDALIHIADLNEDGVRRLLKASLRDSGVKLTNVDFAAVYKECEGYYPAFVHEVGGRALRYAMVRLHDAMPSELATEDFVKAANSLRPQFDLMTVAHEIRTAPPLEASLHNVIADVLETAVIKDGDNDQSYYVRKFEFARK